MIYLTPFTSTDFDQFISWVDSEELLITIAGSDFSYPLTTTQLLTYVADETSRPYKVMDTASGEAIGHAELRTVEESILKVDKFLIIPSYRRKGMGEYVLKILVHHAFTLPYVQTVELNVLHWNLAGIKCYEKVGFTINPEKEQCFEVNGQNWTALNMQIHKENLEPVVPHLISK